MLLGFITLVAVLSTALNLFLWFRDVWRTMRYRRNVVESANGQLMVYRKKACQAQGDPEVAAVLSRSERIYQQAADIYNNTLQKPWILLPAYMMGFRHILAKEGM